MAGKVPPIMAGSMMDMLEEAKHRLEIEARQNSYAVATEIAKNVITRYGNHEGPAVVTYWTAIADGVYKKIKADMDAIFAQK